MELFNKKKKELSFEEENDLFERCLSVICNCSTPDQRTVAGKYIAQAAKKVSDDLWEQEMWIKGVNTEVLNYILPRNGGEENDDKGIIHSNLKVICRDYQVDEEEQSKV